MMTRVKQANSPCSCRCYRKAHKTITDRAVVAYTFCLRKLLHISSAVISSCLAVTVDDALIRLSQKKVFSTLNVAAAVVFALLFSSVLHLFALEGAMDDLFKIQQQRDELFKIQGFRYKRT